jgi:single-stranded DNA-binding protein
MSQSVTIGRVIADFDLKTSANDNSYVRFSLAENIGYGESSHTQFLQVWAWGDDAKHLIKSKVKKGSLIWISGQLTLEEFKKQDGITTDKRLKVILDSWGYIPGGMPRRSAGNESTPQDATETNTPHDALPGGEIDGDRETLPE